jgi:ABC-type bacteriocin/lantibiotic exporter with double-glycine peptidase domain
MSYGDYEDKEFFRKLAAKGGVADIPWVKNAINSTLLLQNPKCRQKLLRFLSIKTEQNVREDHPFLPAPSKSQVSEGAYELVKVVTGLGPQYSARIREADASEHGIIVGPSGAGKTTWLIHMGLQIHRKGAST